MTERINNKTFEFETITLDGDVIYENCVFIDCWFKVVSDGPVVRDCTIEHRTNCMTRWTERDFLMFWDAGGHACRIERNEFVQTNLKSDLGFDLEEALGSFPIAYHASIGGKEGPD